MCTDALFGIGIQANVGCVLRAFRGKHAEAYTSAMRLVTVHGNHTCLITGAVGNNTEQTY
jgi:hypothetical protein